MKKKTLRQAITDILRDKICIDSDYCYCDGGGCSGGHDYLSGVSEAIECVEELLQNQKIDLDQVV